MKVILDTNVLVAATRSPRGASFGILARLNACCYTLLVSVPLFLEYEAVLKRPSHLEVAGLGLADVDAILDMVARHAHEVVPYFTWRPLARDPGDDMVMETAIAGGADVIVTFNTRDFGSILETGIAVIEPRHFLEKIR